jgi:hypothetical protein
MLTPVIALTLWTFVIEIWLYATRIPAMRAARIDPRRVKRKNDIDGLPVAVKQVADNFSHLHEQPMVFYVLAICAQLIGLADPISIALAWIYVVLRVAHSIIQCTWNFVPVRFTVFVVSSAVLLVIALRDFIHVLLHA